MSGHGGDNYYRDAEGKIIGPDVFIAGKPYEGTPLRTPLEVENDRLEAENHRLREDARVLLDALSDDHYGIGTPSPLVAEAIRMMRAAVVEE